MDTAKTTSLSSDHKNDPTDVIVTGNAATSNGTVNVAYVSDVESDVTANFQNANSTNLDPSCRVQSPQQQLQPVGGIVLDLPSDSHPHTTSVLHNGVGVRRRNNPRSLQRSTGSSRSSDSRGERCSKRNADLGLCMFPIHFAPVF